MADIPEYLKQSHTETNEDGNTMVHPGYMNRQCTKCGANVMVSKVYCGAVKCGDVKRDGPVL